MPRLPNFLIIGAARSGTTSLYHSLCEHPDVFMPTRKEPQFFTSNWSRGMDWYARHFEGCSGESAVGEGSVSYTYPQYPDTVTRIAETLPGVKLIYMVRHPVDRAFSHYQYYRNYSHTETHSFEDAIDRNPVYIGASSYCEWIEKYLVRFPPSHLKVLVFEEFVASPLEVLKETFAFLGIENAFVPANASLATNKTFQPRSRTVYSLYKKISASRMRRAVESLLPERARPRLRNRVRSILGTGRPAPPMADETRQRLCGLFVPGVHRLESHIGRRIPQWNLSA